MEIFDKKRERVEWMSMRFPIENVERSGCVVGISIGHGVIVYGYLVDVSARQVCEMTCVLCPFL